MDLSAVFTLRRAIQMNTPREKTEDNCLYLINDTWVPARIVRTYVSKRGVDTHEIDFGGRRNVRLSEHSPRLIVKNR